ncbi:hypothetical protein EDC96DRAFT_498922 [Choanephora cucurbitarum]|nr:hypothetical protein EDC96DRAFT_498922 [Choanephora cucurbitarum]
MQTNRLNYLDKSKSYSCLVPEKQSSTSLQPCNNNKNKRFHTAQLGKPPGVQPTSPMIPYPAINTPHPPIKIAPMKEVEKMMADLKKENFDLKLRLYHLENLLNKDSTDLRDQNHKLRTQLEQKTRRIQTMEREIQALLERVNLNDPPTVVSIATQTESMSVFASSPEAFGLEPRKKPQTVSWQRQVVANEDHLMSVLHALQHVHIDKNKLNTDSWSKKNTSRGSFQK